MCRIAGKTLVWALVTTLAAAPLSGCLVPEAGALTGHQSKRDLFYAVVRGVQCEIRKSIWQQVNGPYADRLQWLRQWSALMHFTFTFETQGSFNPGVTLKTPNLLDANVWLANGVSRSVPQDYSFGAGASIGGDAKRVEDVGFFYPFNKDFFAKAAQDREDGGCYHIGGFSIGGDLQLHDWLDDVLEPIKHCAFIGAPVRRKSTAAPLIGLDAGTAPEDDPEPDCPPGLTSQLGYSRDNPIKTFSHEVSFVVTFQATATPMWNLVRISASGAPLFSGKREDTFDLKITLGSADTESPIARKTKGDRLHPLMVSGAAPSRAMLDRDLALQIGAAVRDATR